jgi:HD-GYP domain-containing protein (c-di-GMP phosphodiesterase class II)
MRSYPLKTFVKRILLIRLGVAALVLALTAGAVTYFYQKELLSRQVADIGRQGIATLTRRVMEAAERQEIEPAAALPQVLAAAAETPTAYLLGHFVFVQFLDRSGTVVAEGSAPAADQVEAGGDLAKARPLVFPETGRAEAETHRRGDGLFVLSVVPVADRLGAVKGYARGVFAVSTEAGQQMRRAVMRSALIVVAIVCGVTAILYPVILQLTRRLADYSSSLLDANLETLAVLGSAIAKRDADTDAHNYRVSLYSVRLGEAIGLDPAAMRGLIKGAFIHDVGKIGIPDAVLLKAGRLDAEEYRIMQSHVEAGVDIVSRSAWLARRKRRPSHHFSAGIRRRRWKWRRSSRKTFRFSASGWLRSMDGAGQRHHPGPGAGLSGQAELQGGRLRQEGHALVRDRPAAVSGHAGRSQGRPGQAAGGAADRPGEPEPYPALSGGQRGQSAGQGQRRRPGAECRSPGAGGPGAGAQGRARFGIHQDHHPPSTASPVPPRSRWAISSARPRPAS